MRFTSLLVFLIIGRLLYAQTALFTHYGMGTGLSQSSVYLIYQDKQGFMWFGTGDGLNRYDGHNFKVYRHSSNLHTQSSNFYGRHAAEDSAGNIYFSGRTGLCFYNKAEDRILYLFPGRDSVTFSRIVDVLAVKRSVLWFSDCHANLFALNLKTGKLTAVPLKDPTYNGSVFRTLNMDEAGCVWYTLHKGVGCYNIHTRRFSFHLTELFKGYNDDLFQDAVRISDDRVIIAAYFTVIDYNPLKRTWRFLIPFSKDGTYMHLAKDANKNIYVGSLMNGLIVFDSTGARSGYPHKTTLAGGPGSNIITRLCTDEGNNLWMGCDGFGLSKVNFASNRFKLFRFKDEVSNGFNPNFIKTFYTDKNNLWVSVHENGIQIIDRQSGKTKALKRNIPGANTISSIVPLNDKEVLVGSGAGVSCINTQTFRSSSLPFLDSGIVMLDGQNHIMSFFRLRNDHIYACSREGLFYLPRENGSIRGVKKVKPDWRPFLAAGIQTKDGSMWVSSLQYAFVYRMQETAAGEVVIKENLLRGMNVRCFYEDTAACLLWMASEKGLIRYQLENNTYTIIDESQGLSDNYLYAVLPGNKNELWLSSNRGLMRYNTLSGRTDAFYESDGLQSNEFNTGSYYRSTSGELFFGGINGFNYFYPSAIKTNLHKPSVALTQLKINDEEAGWLGNPSALGSINLPFTSNTLSFEFAGLEFTNESKNRYQYKLSGVDNNWVKADGKHFARYSALDPGTYHFYAKACNHDGIWSNEQLLATVIINPPWWKTWWFMLLITSALLAALFLGIRAITTRKLKERLRELEKQDAINKERTRISKDMHDDLGSGLTKIAIMSELLKKQYQQTENGQVDKISKTAGDLIDSMSHIIWAMNPENDKIENLLAYLREYAHDFFDDTPVRCSIAFPELPVQAQISQQARRNLFLVYKETLNNSLKHAQAQSIRISSSLIDNKLNIHVQDDGKGFDTGQARTFGNGLINMQKRMKDAGGTYTIISKPGEGTFTELVLEF